jgi:hypothetical protein
VKAFSEGSRHRLDAGRVRRVLNNVAVFATRSSSISFSLFGEQSSAMRAGKTFRMINIFWRAPASGRRRLPSARGAGKGH